MKMDDSVSTSEPDKREAKTCGTRDELSEFFPEELSGSRTAKETLLVNNLMLHVEDGCYKKDRRGFHRTSPECEGTNMAGDVRTQRSLVGFS